MTIKNIIVIGLLSATLSVGKLALSFVPNVEIVSFLLILYTLNFGYRRSMMIAFIFVTTEMFIYGFGTWIITYYFIWIGLVSLVNLMKKYISTDFGWAILSALFGLSFGFIFALFESFYYGIAYGIQYWIRGIPFDAIHMISNYILIIVLYKPISLVFQRLNPR